MQARHSRHLALHIQQNVFNSCVIYHGYGPVTGVLLTGPDVCRFNFDIITGERVDTDLYCTGVGECGSPKVEKFY